MARQLSTIVLPDGTGDQGEVQWPEEHQDHNVSQQVERTLSGNLVVHVGALSAGIPVTILAANNIGWLTLSEVQAIESLSAVPGASYTLIWDGVSYNVAFRHHQSPAVAFQEIWPGAGFYLGEIRLMTV